jgi:hypothetical protein
MMAYTNDIYHSNLEAADKNIDHKWYKTLNHSLEFYISMIIESPKW